LTLSALRSPGRSPSVLPHVCKYLAWQERGWWTATLFELSQQWTEISDWDWAKSAAV
jgi:hypothetical protein